MEKKYKVIMDNVGRHILGVLESETDEQLVIQNPIIIHLQPSANGQLELQMFPLFFFELLNKDKRDKNSWTYYKKNIVDSNVTINDDIISRYGQINSPPSIIQKPNNPKVISIDDL